jgi:hypothetical protein
VVIIPHQRAAADGDGFLSDVKMEESPDLFALIGAEAAFFEPSDAKHLAVKLNFGFRKHIHINNNFNNIGGLFGGG